MSEDASYQEDCRMLAEEFETSDWEAVKLTEAVPKITLDLP